MSNQKIFILQDEESYVKDFDIERQQLVMTQNWSEVHLFTLMEALRVVDRLGWLASERLTVKAVQGIF